MDLYEYQGKQFFARYGIPVSDGAPVDTVPEAVEVADRIGYPVVVKRCVSTPPTSSAWTSRATR